MRNITAEQVALAEEAANELEQMGKQILDPPHIAKKFRDWAFAVRFVIENFSTAELALESYETDKTIQQRDIYPSPKNLGPPPTPPKPKCGRCKHGHAEHDRRTTACTVLGCECRSYLYPAVA